MKEQPQNLTGRHRRPSLSQLYGIFTVPDAGGREYKVSGDGGPVVYYERGKDGSEYLYNESEHTVLQSPHTIRAGAFRINGEAVMRPFIQHILQIRPGLKLIVEGMRVIGNDDQLMMSHNIIGQRREGTAARTVITDYGNIISTELYSPTTRHVLIFNPNLREIDYEALHKSGLKERGVIDISRPFRSTIDNCTILHYPQELEAFWASINFPQFTFNLLVPYAAQFERMAPLLNYMRGDEPWNLDTSRSPLLSLGINFSLDLPPRGTGLQPTYER